MGDPPRWQRDTPLSAKVGTKFRQQMTVAQSVEFARGLKATELVLSIKCCFRIKMQVDTHAGLHGNVPRCGTELPDNSCSKVPIWRGRTQRFGLWYLTTDGQTTGTWPPEFHFLNYAKNRCPNGHSYSGDSRECCYTYVTKTQTNFVALSPRANYTDWATATFRRNLAPTFVDRGVSRGQRGGSPTVVNLSFIDRSRYFSFK
jgi:hypothetical protein